MPTRTTGLSILLGLGVLAAVAAGVVAFRGAGPAVLRGVALGVLGGAGASALEVVLVRRALLQARNVALGIVLGGFFARLVALVAGAFLLDGTGIADAPAFALCFLGGFFSSLPVLAAAVSGNHAPGGGEARP